MTDSDFTEPGHRHHPGVNARPDGGQLAEIVSAAEDASNLDDPAVQRAWRYGLFLMNHRYFWEAHEALEPVWMKASPNSRERYLVQGLIQLANACLKADMGRKLAALRLLDLAEEHLFDAASGSVDVVLGLDVHRCQITLVSVRGALQSGAPWHEHLESVSAI